MKRTALETYAMVACILLGLYSLMIISVSISNILFLANPAWQMTDEKDAQYLDNDAFCQENLRACDSETVLSQNSRVNIECSGKEDCAQKQAEQLKQIEAQEEAREAERKAATSPEAITKKRLEAYENEQSVRHARAVVNLVHNLIQGAIVFVLFAVHWRIGFKKRSSENEVKA